MRSKRISRRCRRLACCGTRWYRMPLRHIQCAPGAHIGEEIAAEFIRDTFKDSDGVLLSNYHHPNGIGAGTDEIDLLLVNSRGVWLLEVKHWFGHIVADQYDWLQAGRRH